jgi:hypothetical protein
MVIEKHYSIKLMNDKIIAKESVKIKYINIVKSA